MIQIVREIAPQMPVGVEVVDTLYTDRPDNSRRGEGGNVGDPGASYAGITRATGPLDDVLDGHVTKIFMVGATTVLGNIQGPHFDG